MANGTLKVSNIQTSSGSGTITLGQSGETVVFGSGVTTKYNQPAFQAKMSTNPSFTDGVTTKLSLDTEIFDTNSAYDATTNYRFTVPSGFAGKYNVYGATQAYASSNSNLVRLTLYIYINGSSVEPYISETDYQTSYIRDGFENINVVLDLSEGDYIELYANANTNGGQAASMRSEYTYFGAYRLGA